jgi:hypothetical protein
MFVNGQPVEVTVGENTISVRPKMDLGTKNRCMDALAAIGRENGETEMAVHLGAYQVALMVENIVSWRGPAFVGVPCTPANIAKLDPDEPLVELVLEEIVARNPLQKKGEQDAEKKDGTNAGEPSLPASA